MAKLVDPSAAERPTARNLPGGQGFRTNGPSDAAAKGMLQLGADVSRGADELFHAQKVEEDRINTLRAEEAFTKLRDRQLDLSIGEQNGFTKLRGSAAVERPVLPEWGKRFQDVETEISAGLSNDEQRLKFKKRADVTRIQFNEEILRHLAREGDTYAKEVYDGTVHTEQRNAVARWDSPNDVGLSLTRIKAAVDERAERFGWAPPYRDAMLQQESGKVHAAVVQQAIASGDYKYAQQWFNEHKADVDLATAKVLERAVEDGTQKELANGYRSEYLANESSQTALEDLRKRVLGDQKLDDQRRNVLVGQIQNRQSALERRADLDRERQLRTIERGIGELNANTLAGFEPSADQFSPFITAAKGTEAEPQVRAAIALADATRSFRNQPPAVQERLLAESEAGVRDNPTKFDRKIVGAWRTIYDAQQRQVKEDPITFAVRQGIVASPAPLDLAQPSKMQGELSQRFEIARGMAARYPGAQLKPLTEQETTLMRTVLKGAPAEQKRQWFAGLSQAAGNDYEGYSAVMAQLAPDDPVTAVAGQYAYRGRTAASDLMLRGQALQHPNRKEDGSPDKGKLWPMPPEADLAKAFNSYENDAYAGHAKTRNAVFQSAIAIYTAKSADEGDASATINNNRWEESIRLASGGIEKWNGKGTVMPYGYTMSQFKDGLSQRLRVMEERGQLGDGATPGKLYDLPLESVGDGRYVFRSGDGVMVGKDRQPLMVDFNEAMPYRPSGDQTSAVPQLAPFGGKLNAEQVRNPNPARPVPAVGGVRG